MSSNTTTSSSDSLPYNITNENILPDELNKKLNTKISKLRKEQQSKKDKKEREDLENMIKTNIINTTNLINSYYKYNILNISILILEKLIIFIIIKLFQM